jgi:hypothetical protein
MTELPKDPWIRLSYVNTLLRDRYPSLEDLCTDYDADCSTLLKVFESMGYIYISRLNQFKPKI